MYPSNFVFVAITALASFIAATPPACLLAAVQEQPNPADLKALCGTLEPQMASNITASCSGSVLASAIADYSSTCLAQGVTVSITTSAPSGSQTGSSAPTATAATTTGSGSGTNTGTAATTSATGKSGATSISAPSAGLWISIILACSFASQYVL